MDKELRELFMTQRKALLEQVDAIERLLDISPRTAEMRRKVQDPPPQYEIELKHLQESKT